MSADQALRDGNLDEALAELQQQVRAKPADSKLRVFLFQLLTVQGQWDRALTQLNVSGELDAGTLAMVQTYREALRCEALRQEIFAGKRSPMFFGEPEQWMALLTESLRLAVNGEGEQADKLRAEAFDAAPTTSGTISTRVVGGKATEASSPEPFAWIADADQRLGPVCEAIVNGRYYWIPFHRISRIDVEPPADLRDVVWTPVHFVWTNGGDTVGLMPTRYPDSHNHPDPLIRLARKTDWTQQPGSDTLWGVGQRMLATDAGEFPLMDVRCITLDSPLDLAPPPAPQETHG